MLVGGGFKRERGGIGREGIGGEQRDGKGGDLGNGFGGAEGIGLEVLDGAEMGGRAHLGLGALALEAGAAKHRASLGGLEGDGGFKRAGRANGTGFGAGKGKGEWAAGSDGAADAGALGFAELAAFGVVGELLGGEEELFARGEDEGFPADGAFQKPVGEVHGAFSQWGNWLLSVPEVLEMGLIGDVQSLRAEIWIEEDSITGESG